MSGIDWEEILGAEGADLQDAYDERVAEAAEWMDRDDEEYDQPPEDEEAEIQDADRYELRMLGLWRPAHELEALRKQMEKAFHLRLHWEYDAAGRMENLVDARGSRVMLSWMDSRWRLVFPVSPKNVSGFEHKDRVTFCSARLKDDLLDRLVKDERGDEVEGEYEDDGPWPYWRRDSDGLPLKLIDRDGETAWDREKEDEGEILWVCDVYPTFAGPEFAVKELYCRGDLIWKAQETDGNPYDLSKLLWYDPKTDPDNFEIPFD